MPRRTFPRIVVVVAVAAALTVVAVGWRTTNAFVPPSLPSQIHHQQQRLLKRHDHVTTRRMLLVDPNDVIVHAQGQPDWSSLITAAASATAADASSNDGWWSAYLNIFKTALLAVHTTIDQPLRSMGITQTWGPSIALFTAGTFRNHVVVSCVCGRVLFGWVCVVVYCCVIVSYGTDCHLGPGSPLSLQHTPRTHTHTC
jgi:hypothetical protein